MKKAASPDLDARDVAPEYRFDYSKAKPNRFAERFEKGAVAVVLDPDVAAVFHDAEAVNGLLRSVIAALPLRSRRPRSQRKAG